MRNYSEIENDARLWAFFPDDNLTSQADVGHLSIDPFQQTTPLLIRPPQISDRIVAQSGCFVLHPFDPVKNDFIPLQQLDSLVESVVIPHSCMPAIVAELDRCGINEMSMFPGLDSLAGYLTLKVGH